MSLSALFEDPLDGMQPQAWHLLWFLLTGATLLVVWLVFKLRQERHRYEHMKGCRQQERNGRIKAERLLKETKTGAFALSADPSEAADAGEATGAASSSGTGGSLASRVPAGLMVRPVGHVRSAYPRRNGTPRQACLVPSSRGEIIFHGWVHPQLSLDSLQQFSHVWVLFVFHFNTNMHKDTVRPRIRPPRLGRKRVGIYATRTPHRPNSIGISLCRIHSVAKGVLQLSGLDLVSGTPVLDVKPFVKEYDSLEDYRVPTWLEEPIERRPVVFTEAVEATIASHWRIKPSGKRVSPPKSFYQTAAELKTFLTETLAFDIRGQRQKETELRDYTVNLDVLEIVWAFSPDQTTVVVKSATVVDPDQLPFGDSVEPLES